MNVTSVKIVVRNAEGKILLQMRDGTAGISSPLMWGMWGGGVEAYDTDPQAAAMRELEEELGLAVTTEDMVFLGQTEFAEGKMENTYLYNKPVKWGEFVVNEGAGAAFFSKSELQQIPVARSIQRLLALNAEVVS